MDRRYVIWWMCPQEIETLLDAHAKHERNGTIPANTGNWPVSESIRACLRSMDGRAPKGAVWTNYLDSGIKQPHFTSDPFHQVLQNRYNGILINRDDKRFARYRGIVTETNLQMVPFQSL